MDYLKVIIETESPAAELLADSLAYVTGGCEIDDPNAYQELFSPSAPRWDYIEPAVLAGGMRPCTVCFYLATDEKGQHTLREACRLVAQIKEEDSAGFYGKLSIDIAPMENQDWQNSWKQFFKPVEIGSRLLVRPSWEPAPNEHSRVELVIDPSSSFGTGTHATTKMCLEWLDGANISGKKALDMGCGSGILACAALLFGARHAVCCDIEPASMIATRENMQRNGIGDARFTAVLGDILSSRQACAPVWENAPYDIITANIVSDVLIAMADTLSQMLAQRGRIALSGIIDERAAEVAQAFSNTGMKRVHEHKSEGWTMLVFEH